MVSKDSIEEGYMRKKNKKKIQANAVYGLHMSEYQTKLKLLFYELRLADVQAAGGCRSRAKTPGKVA
jgi:hypothetical protein